MPASHTENKNIPSNTKSEMIAEYKASAGNTLTITKTHHWGHDLSNTPQGAGGIGGLLATSIKQSNGSWKSYLPSYDGNGNIIAWTSETGGVLQRIDYDPFGNTLTKNGSFPDEEKLTFGFSTKYEDQETGLLYYGYRYYDPVTGRWPSRDPIGERGGINLYGMVGNNPIRWVDYLGLQYTPFNGGARTGGGNGADEAEKSCSITVRGGHAFGEEGNQAHFNNNSDGLGPENSVCYVGCGANGLNESAEEEGGGVPNYPENNHEDDPDSDTMEDAGFDRNDLLSMGDTATQLAAAVAAARHDAVNKCGPPACCDVVTITVECQDDFARIENILNSRFGPPNNMCGRTFSYNCEDDSWD